MGRVLIHRRAFLRALAAAAVSPLAACSDRRTRPEQGAGALAERPGLVVIVADDMRWDALGAAGNRVVHTPNLDGLAAEGSFFANHFVTTSICPTSRASILTGRYARRHGVWDFSTPLALDELESSFPVLLRHSGYQTAFFGKWGIGGALPGSHFDHWEGFEGQGRYFDPEGGRSEHLTSFLAGRALEFLDSRGAAPFLVLLSFKAPHAEDGAAEPFPPDPSHSALYENVTVPRAATATAAHFEQLPAFLKGSLGRELWEDFFGSDEGYQHSVKEYYRLVTGLDEAVGRVLSSLRDKGLYEQTCVVFTSDNGFLLGEHGLAGKWWGYEESIRTPLLIKLPGASLVRRVEAMTLNVDLCPTLLDLAGLPPPSGVQGLSLLPMLRGESERTRDAWLYEHLFEHPGIPPSEGVRTAHSKYLRFMNEGEGGELLFDLARDPFEETNLARDPAHRAALLEHRALLERLERELEPRS